MLFQEINQLITYDERQRMVPADRDRLATIVAGVRDADDYATLRALGVGLVVLGEYAAAMDHLHRALALAENARMRLAASINLADAYRYSGDAATSETICREMVALARAEVPEMLYFPLQHLGKTLGEQGRIEEARSALEEAMALRVAQGDPELIVRTEAALRLLDAG